VVEVCLRDGTKPCEMKKRSLLFPTKVGGQLYICVKVAERRKAVRGSMSLSRTMAFMSATFHVLIDRINDSGKIHGYVARSKTHGHVVRSKIFSCLRGEMCWNVERDCIRYGLGDRRSEPPCVFLAYQASTRS